MFTTLLSDTTDVLYDSKLPTIRSLPNRYPSFHTVIQSSGGRENYCNSCAKAVLSESPFLERSNHKITDRSIVASVGDRTAHGFVFVELPPSKKR